MQINGEGRLLGAPECSLYTSDCDFWLLKRVGGQNKAKLRFFTGQLQARLSQENILKCKRKPNHIQLHVGFQGMETLCESRSACLLSWSAFFLLLLKRKMEFRGGKIGKRTSWQN